MDTGQGRSGKSYVVETNPKVIQRCMLMTTDPGDLVLDPTCGSGTTAYVAEAVGKALDNYRYVSCCTRFGTYSSYVCYNIRTIVLKIQTTSSMGFAYKTAPHISLSDMANNTEIDDIHTEYAKKLDPLRAEMNHLIGQNWEEWEVPIEIDLSRIHNFRNCIANGYLSSANGNARWTPPPPDVPKM